MTAALALLLACPFCAAQQPGGTGAAVLVLAMIGVPYAIAVFVIRAIRNVDRP